MQQCPFCNHLCPATAKFCEECGKELTSVSAVNINPTIEGVPILFNQQNQRVARDQYNAGRDINVIQRIFNSLEAQQQYNRTAMLRKVRATWINRFLAQSLDQVPIIQPVVQYVPDAVADPWEALVQPPACAGKSVPDGVTMVDLFDKSGSALLLLGVPGSGKTIILLELAAALIERAEQDEIHPIPVVFNLSSWAEKRPSLTVWLITELRMRYDVSHKIARSWITNDQVLPLLDGLDEVHPELRSECVEAINTYRQEHGQVGMVVCSRVHDYQTLTPKLRLHRAVQIQPLTEEHIDAYLQRVSDKTGTVRQVWQQLQASAWHDQDPIAQAMLRTPLMLNIITQAYQDLPGTTLPVAASVAEQYRHLFATYVQEMFRRRGVSKNYAPQQARQCLAWLAAKMVQYNQTSFFIEHISQSWLPTSTQRTIYALTIGLIGGILSGTLIGLLISLMWSTPGGMLAGLATGLALGCALGVHSWRQTTIETVETLTWRWSQIQESKTTMILFGIGIVFLAALVGVGTGLALTAIQGVLTFLVMAIGLLVLLMSLAGLARGRVLSETDYPNERIWRSLRTFAMVVSGCILGGAFILGVVGVLLGGLLGGGATAVSAGTTLAAQAAWIGLLSGLLLGGLFFGGLACLQHVILRLLLTYKRVIPWNYARFLDYAAERLFLHKIVGSYIFIHPMLLEYFASLEDTQPEQSRHS